MMNLKSVAAAVILVTMAAPVAAVTNTEARVFDEMLNGVYTDGSSKGLYYIKRFDGKMLLINKRDFILLPIDSVQEISEQQTRATVINPGGGAFVLNGYGDMLEIITPAGRVIQTRYARDFIGSESEEMATYAADLRKAVAESDAADAAVRAASRAATTPAPAVVAPTANQIVAAGPIKASFDCAKAGNRVEYLICGNANVAALDVEVAERYKTAMALTNDKTLFRQEQRDWLKERNVCQDASCMVGAYQDRIEHLNLVISHMN